MNIRLSMLAATSVLLSTVAVADTNMKNSETNLPADSEKKMTEINRSGIDNIDIEGTPVVNDQDEIIGAVKEVVRSANGKVAVIGLSDRPKEIAVSLGDLSHSSSSDRLMINVTMDQLESQPDIDPTGYEELKPGEYSKRNFADKSEETKTESKETFAANQSSDEGKLDSKGSNADYTTAVTRAEDGGGDIDGGKAISDEMDNSSKTVSGGMDSSKTASGEIDIEGQDVVNVSGERIGNVDKVVQSDAGKMAVTGLSGSAKEVAVPLGELSYDQDHLVIKSTKADLESKADIDMSEFEELEPGQYQEHEFARFEDVPPKQ